MLPILSILRPECGLDKTSDENFKSPSQENCNVIVYSKITIEKSYNLSEPENFDMLIV